MEIIKSLNKVTEKDIANLEEYLSIKIPYSYKEFLLKNCGGKPDKDNFYRELDSGGVYDFDISVFLGISSNSSFDLRNTYVRMMGIIPKGFLPITDDGVGNSICIGLKDEYLDKIYIWWEQNVSAEDATPNFNNVEKLADSFAEFKKYLK